jgi:hypothetical protein
MPEAVIKATFKEGNGKGLIAHGQWELFDSKTPNRSISENVRVRPVTQNTIRDISSEVVQILQKFATKPQHITSQ